jgi:RNA polymerase sigma-70 factor (ECF subfamily)
MSEPEAHVQASRLRLFDATRDSVYRFLRHLVRNDDEAADLFQESYLRAFAALESFRGEASPTTWVLTIARNVAFNRMRRRRLEARYRTAVDEPPDAPDPAADEARRADEARIDVDRRLTEAISRLSPAQREAVLLYYIEDRAVEEVARITGRAANTVKSDLKRAREALRRELGEEMSE